MVNPDSTWPAHFGQLIECDMPPSSVRQLRCWNCRQEAGTLTRTAERAEHAAISWLWSDDGPAFPALVEVQASVRREGLAGDTAAVGASDQAGRAVMPTGYLRVDGADPWLRLSPEPRETRRLGSAAPRWSSDLR